MSERRLAENEVFFRQSNEKVGKGMKELEDIAKEEKQGDWMQEANNPVPFYCECSDENCRRRITFSPHAYRELHQNSSQFVILPGHHVPEVEQIVQKTKAYMVVEKYIAPPANINTLKPTDIDNN